MESCYKARCCLDAIRFLRISKPERIRNEFIVKKIGFEDNLTEDIEKKQLIWHGRVQQMPTESNIII